MTRGQIAKKFNNKILSVLREFGENMKGHGLNFGEPIEDHDLTEVPKRYDWMIRAPVPSLMQNEFVDVEIRLNEDYQRPGEVIFRIVLGTYIPEVDSKLLCGEDAVSAWMNDPSEINKMIESISWVQVERCIKNYLGEAERRFREGPREWSPRWDQPSMGGSGGRGVKTYEYGPLRVEVDTSLGLLQPPWGGIEYRPTYHLEVRDGHGNVFEAGWYDDGNAGPERVSQRLVILLESATSDRRNWLLEFSRGYSQSENAWRKREAYRILKEMKNFDSVEIRKAAEMAVRKISYEDYKGPRDWSPIGEMPE